MSRFNINLNDGKTTFIERKPEVVHGGDEKFVLRDTFRFPLDGLEYLEEIWVFNGLDRGNFVEMDTFIYDGHRPLVLSSYHKETYDNFDAYCHYRVHRKLLGEHLSIAVTCRSTSGLDVRPHWGIWLLWKEKE